ncbi:DUF2513 domain-containing protein [Clostridium minihomine]|uniref:DUF2513 domain-containing protein n=1 Tax=Clostridium minihomine TaxID=2045012 RepID=UPI000C75D571|nr:DUF2513 domain-containing protein [Clostridium minihomine]
MRLNPDCVRDILLYIENAPYREIITPEEIVENVSGYNLDEIEYACEKLEEGNLINADIKTYSDGNLAIYISSISYNGHQFLENIRKDEIWDGVKNVASKIGTNSLSALSQISSSVVLSLIKAHFGLNL